MIKKPIKYLDLGNGRYIENDVVKMRIDENDKIIKSHNWDESWEIIINALEKLKKYENDEND